jgi:hypothetical protein
MACSSTEDDSLPSARLPAKTRLRRVDEQAIVHPFKNPFFKGGNVKMNQSMNLVEKSTKRNAPLLSD